ncbi:MAG: AMP-binding protein, partial [Nocardioides sp.]|nr:AMP-binding protein [Nocardioides sp.]
VSRNVDIVASHDPDVIVTVKDGEPEVDVRRPGSAHRLHPELSLLLSTSGSTGSPKLVRLSRANVAANAASIAEYLALTPDDCGVTSLPLHYCYGLSILHSHLAVGASVVVTDLSVVDSCFWDLAGRAGVTGVAGVPHTFDLLDHSGFSDRDLPRLRYVTQAGGRLDPARVSTYHELGRQAGWDFYVMYGQTEATARMAYLPPDLAEEYPQAIGRAVPGGRFHLEPVEGAGPEVGELVYTGPNVMMGYAHDPRDLAMEPMPPVLHTGDLARELPDGLFEVVGRRSRFVKVFGLRINLDEVERHLATQGIESRAVGVDGHVDVFVTRRRKLHRAVELAAQLCGVPTWVVRTHLVRQFPVTGSGKPDWATLVDLAQSHPARASARAGTDAEDLRRLYARVLGRADVTCESSFVGLGADSLSYVEMAVQLGSLIDPLPVDWHQRTISSLAAKTGGRRRRGMPLETNVVLRAVAIVLVVGSHTELFDLTGGAHLLLALAGFNLARFHLGHGPGDQTWRRIGWAVAAIAIPSALWIGAVAVLTGDYDLSTVTFLNWQLGSEHWDDRWRFWFLEALVWSLAAVAVLFAARPVRALEKRHPFAVAAGVLTLGLVLRLAEVGITADGISRYTPTAVFWCFALGWLMARSETRVQQIAVSLVIVLSFQNFFGEPDRERLIVAGLLIALWVPMVRVPRLVARVAGVLATASLAIYLTHWQIYPHLEVNHSFLAVVASVALGVGYHHLSSPVVDLARRGGPARCRAIAAE